MEEEEEGWGEGVGGGWHQDQRIGKFDFYSGRAGYFSNWGGVYKVTKAVHENRSNSH